MNKWFKKKDNQNVNPTTSPNSTEAEDAEVSVSRGGSATSPDEPQAIKRPEKPAEPAVKLPPPFWIDPCDTKSEGSKLFYKTPPSTKDIIKRLYKVFEVSRNKTHEMQEKISTKMFKRSHDLMNQVLLGEKVPGLDVDTFRNELAVLEFNTRNLNRFLESTYTMLQVFSVYLEFVDLELEKIKIESGSKGTSHETHTSSCYKFLKTLLCEVSVALELRGCEPAPAVTRKIIPKALKKQTTTSDDKKKNFFLVFRDFMDMLDFVSDAFYQILSNAKRDSLLNPSVFVQKL